MYKPALFLTVALIGFFPSLSFAADTAVTPVAPQTAVAGFTDAQRTEIEGIIKEYLTDKHPEVMAQGLELLQKREQEASQNKTKDEVSKAKDKIYNDPSSPVGGNPKGDVTVVEFYDYQCGYCKMSEDAVERLLKEDKNVRFIYKEFPILGPVSAEAAKASVASIKQNKFQIFHDTLMSKKDHLSSDMIYQVAKDVGMNVDKLKKDMAENSVNDVLNGNLTLGQDIGVRGTPMFIVGDNVYPGAMQNDALKKAVDSARSAEKKP